MAKKTVPPSEGFRDLLAAAEQASGVGGVYGAAKHGEFYWGVDLGEIPLQYLIGGQNILPYGHMVEIAGQPGSLKSTLLLEFGRMFAYNGGGMAWVESELKAGAEIAEMVVGRKYVSGDDVRILHYPDIKTMSEWQERVTQIIDFKKKVDAKCRFPLLIGVDSLTARATEEELEKFNKEGHAQERGFPVGAMSLTNFAKNLPTLLIREGKCCLPVIFIGVNHLKQVPDTRGYGVQFYTPGGKGKEFQASLRLWTKVKYRDQVSQNVLNERRPFRYYEEQIELTGVGDMRKLQVDCAKSSFGPDHRRIEVDYFWGWDKNGQQHAWFDWDGALVTLISEESVVCRTIVNVVNSGKTWNVSKISTDGQKVFIAKDVSITIAGMAIKKDPEIMQRLRDHYHIRNLRVHIGGEAPPSQADG